MILHIITGEQFSILEQKPMHWPEKENVLALVNWIKVGPLSNLVAEEH